MLSKMNSRCEVDLSWKKCSNNIREYQLAKIRSIERKRNGNMTDGLFVGSTTGPRSDEPPLLLLFLLFGLIFV